MAATGIILSNRQNAKKKKRNLEQKPENNPHTIECMRSSRKEVFQPHLPVRLPCYDLAPVTCFTLGRSSRSRTSGPPGSHGLTGGVYKARERIHRAMADARLLANPASPENGFKGLASCHQVAALCTAHCNTCVAPDVRAVLI